MKLNGQIYKAALTRRSINSTSYEPSSIIFTAKLLSMRDKARSQIVKGMLTNQTRLTISTNDEWVKDMKQQDKVFIMGEEFIVEAVAADTSNGVYQLGASQDLKHYPLIITLC